MLKLIINKSKNIHQDKASQESETEPMSSFSLQNSFIADFREFSSNLYIFRAKEQNHALTCSMTVEVKKFLADLGEEGSTEQYLVPVIACSFPPIDVRRLNEKIGGDDYLHGALLFQFQLKVLEQLLLFGEEKDAAHLMLGVHDADLDYLEAYRRFIVSEEQAVTAKGEQTQVVIPTDMETYDKIIDFMDEVDRDFRQTLWRGQKANPLFRQYLKHYSVAG